mgnify:CR=1 FL=1
MIMTKKLELQLLELEKIYIYIILLYKVYMLLVYHNVDWTPKPETEFEIPVFSHRKVAKHYFGIFITVSPRQEAAQFVFERGL